MKFLGNKLFNLCVLLGVLAATTPGLALATGTDYTVLSDAVETEWGLGKPVVLGIMAVVLAAAALFFVFRRANKAANK